MTKHSVIILAISAALAFPACSIDTSPCGRRDGADSAQVSSSAATHNTNGACDIEMVYVQGGTFTLGCTAEQGDDCYNDEKPAHRVTVDDFYIGKYEITQAQWLAVMGSNASYYRGETLPVEMVSWYDVQDFVRKLNARTGKSYRLPTEAEWEYAARGGRASRGYRYSGSNKVSDVAWYGYNSGGKTHPVGTKSPNELGIYDMSGNVYEWCSDRYGDYSGAAQTNPTGAASEYYRINRGGGWDSHARGTRVSNRDNSTPDNPYYTMIGVRVVSNAR